MLFVIQILTGLFVLLSLSLVVTVPVALAIPGQWETSKDNIFRSATLWTTFVFLIAFANAFVK
jgi:photosystem II core protein PsbZ